VGKSQKPDRYSIFKFKTTTFGQGVSEAVIPKLLLSGLSAMSSPATERIPIIRHPDQEAQLVVNLGKMYDI